MKYEWKVAHDGEQNPEWDAEGNRINDEFLSLTAVLNKAEAEGWEVFSVFYAGDGRAWANNQITHHNGVVLRRPKA